MAGGGPEVAGPYEENSRVFLPGTTVMITFACPKCRTGQQAADNAAGHKLGCVRCGQRLQVPAPIANRTMLGVSAQPGATESAPQWYVARSGKAVGPVSWGHLRRLVGVGELKPEDRVVGFGMSSWQKAGALPNLFAPPGGSQPGKSKPAAAKGPDRK